MLTPIELSVRATKSVRAHENHMKPGPIDPRDTTTKSASRGVESRRTIPAMVAAAYHVENTVKAGLMLRRRILRASRACRASSTRSNVRFSIMTHRTRTAHPTDTGVRPPPGPTSEPAAEPEEEGRRVGGAPRAGPWPAEFTSVWSVAEVDRRRPGPPRPERARAGPAGRRHDGGERPLAARASVTRNRNSVGP